MIKKSLLLIAIPLALCSCGLEKVYTNVHYEFDMAKHVYLVSLLNNGVKEKEWNVNPSNVYFINTYYYKNNSSKELVQNEFYVNGNSYKLYVYNYR